MAYFPNGSDHDYYEAKYCSRCVHRGTDEVGCPVMALHFLWNYDAVGKDADPIKRTALNTLWPRNKDDVHNGDCRMFHAARDDMGGE